MVLDEEKPCFLCWSKRSFSEGKSLTISPLLTIPGSSPDAAVDRQVVSGIFYQAFWLCICYFQLTTHDRNFLNKSVSPNISWERIRILGKKVEITSPCISLSQKHRVTPIPSHWLQISHKFSQTQVHIYLNKDRANFKNIWTGRYLGTIFRQYNLPWSPVHKQVGEKQL